ncbi:LOW QUALITY PROTEIN: hypothetical protein ACJ72_03339 [Emergomyces africanus]|uniref:Uncharacterized protein n=1 Tax=Emergomyces africanus TaxID=1955775 RepID=A0A1B7NZX0_9EURO|nr:LOW QUALITY PROTEIN: hypothetical protein ACJ72_03339 [Emergomyces africanus]
MNSSAWDYEVIPPDVSMISIVFGGVSIYNNSRTNTSSQPCMNPTSHKYDVSGKAVGGGGDSEGGGGGGGGGGEGGGEGWRWWWWCVEVGSAELYGVIAE